MSIENGPSIARAARIAASSGAGIGLECKLDRLLLQFISRGQRGSKEFEHTGIGLSIAERTITRHGERVGAENKEGQGAIFYFTLGQGDTLSTPDTGVEPAPKPMSACFEPRHSTASRQEAIFSRHHECLSNRRYWIASAICEASAQFSPERSAMVRATFRMR